MSDIHEQLRIQREYDRRIRGEPVSAPVPVAAEKPKKRGRPPKSRRTDELDAAGPLSTEAGE